jgi:hypothetical protein
VATGDPQPAIALHELGGTEQCAEQIWVMVIHQGEGHARCILENGHDGRHLYGFALELEPQ